MTKPFSSMKITHKPTITSQWCFASKNSCKERRRCLIKQFLLIIKTQQLITTQDYFTLSKENMGTLKNLLTKPLSQTTIVLQPTTILGCFFKRFNDWQKAKDAFTKAVQVDPHNRVAEEQLRIVEDKLKKDEAGSITVEQ